MTTRRPRIALWTCTALVLAAMVLVPDTASAASPSPSAASATFTRADAVAAAARYGTSRGFHMGVAVLDTRTGQWYGAGDYSGTFASESVVKAFIATRLLATGQMHGSTESRAWKMITQSDDAIATSLYGRVGGDGLINWIKHYYHLWRLGSPPNNPGWWGNTHITARGLVHFYQHVKKDKRVGPWLLNAMHHAHEYGSDGTWQFFGIPSATTGFGVKQGWGCDYNDFCTSDSDYNSTGYVDNDRYTVALLARGPLSAYGSKIAGILTGAARALLPGGQFPDNAPTLTSMSSHWTRSAGGKTIIVRGSGFTKVRRVDFGWVAAPKFSVLSPWRLSVVVPPHYHRMVDVRVITASGTSPKSTADRFTYVDPPWVTSMSAQSGTTAGGQTITITGWSFLSVKRVFFGSVVAPKVTVVSPRQLRVVTPKHAAGATDVRVVSGFGESITRPQDRFTFTAPPAATKAAPTKAAPTKVLPSTPATP